MQQLRIGVAGFGRIGRQIFHLAEADPGLQIVAIADLGAPEILHHLLVKSGGPGQVRLEGKNLVSATGRTRLLPAAHINEIPWDAYGVDLVIDATGRFRGMADLHAHLANGAGRVILSSLPDGPVDRAILYGVNHDSASAADRIVSAGSASTTAVALALKVLTSRLAVRHASMTSVHAYTSDQNLQDYAGPDLRRSRSGAKNIVPNETPARHWVQAVMPELEGRFSAFALNVPVHSGSMLDLTVALETSAPEASEINELFQAAAQASPELLGVTDDPIVSSDVQGRPQSLLVDLKGTMRSGERMVKVFGWHESLGHAHRILDVARHYADLDAKQLSEAS